jgi:TolA-binding protein
MQNLQQTFTASLASMKTLIGQNADNLNKLELALNTLQHSVDRADANNGQNWQQANQQFQALSQSLSDLQARLNKANEALQQIQQAQQNLPAPQTTPAATGNNGAAGGGGAAANGSPVLPAAQLYQNAVSDYVAGSYPLAASEFHQFLKAYASDGHAPEAAYYLGDIQMKERHYKAAVQTFDSVLNNFPDQKVAAGAQLKKAYSLIALRERSAGIRELRNLIHHFPHTQEADQARQELQALGVSAR